MTLSLATIQSASSKELVDFYNLHNPEKMIKKFRNRDVAVARVSFILSCMEIKNGQNSLKDAPTSSELPDESISPEDEVELATAIDEMEKEEVAPTPSTTPAVSSKTHEAQKTSMKLDRNIACRENGHVIACYKNAHQMWKANPTWMTSAQQDALTAKLYAAAKKGEYATVEINGRIFELVNVDTQ